MVCTADSFQKSVILCLFHILKHPKTGKRQKSCRYGMKDGRRPALYKPTAFEIEKMRNRDNAAGDDDWEDENNVERNFWVTFIRKNPMRKGQQRMDLADWGDADASLMGPNGPSFIGKVFRDPMSAKVKLVYDGHNRYDFHAVDLWTRPTVEGSIEKLKKDRYLFKPIPMLYRTWMYHESYRHHKNIDATSEDAGVIREILNFMCIDADLSAGRWSPLVALLPASFCCALTCDELSVGGAVVLTWIMQRAGMMLNSPERYKELRFWLLLPRLTWMAFVIWRAVSWIPDAVPLNIIGLIGTLIFCLLDLFYGDKETFAKYRLSCSYEILKTLPNRVFVCRRVGAADLETLFGARGHVHQNITGIGAWAREMVVIAEIMGCIFELRPFSQKDWNLLIQQSRGDDNARLSVWGLDCYNRRPGLVCCGQAETVGEGAHFQRESTSDLWGDSLKITPRPDVVLKIFDKEGLDELDITVAVEGWATELSEPWTTKKGKTMRSLTLVDGCGTGIPVLHHGHGGDSEELQDGLRVAIFNLTSVEGINGQEGAYWWYSDAYWVTLPAAPMPTLNEVIRVC
eukprot:s2539_g5.t1